MPATVQHAPPPPPPHLPLESDLSQPFWSPQVCRNCHIELHAQFTQSMHSKAFVNPVFQAAFYGKLMSDMAENPSLERQARTCLSCHSPIAFLKSKNGIVPRDEVDVDLSGVTCDFCHTIRGFKGERPGSANYIAVPGETKYGPYQHAFDFHHAYSELHTKAEFCAICHEAKTIDGVDFRTTYSEWREGPYPAQGIQCQDCHMNKTGFLVDGKAHYEKGKAAFMTVGEAPDREVIYSHRFPGAYSDEQIDQALKLRIEWGTEKLAPGAPVPIHVHVDNSKAGHRIPTGSTEVRLVWLEVAVSEGGREPVFLRAEPREGPPGYDVAGAAAWDAYVLRRDIPEGSRIYRTVFVDAQENPTVFLQEVVHRVFDNRLKPGEVRREAFAYTVSPSFAPGDSLDLSARILYRHYPSSFAEQLGVPDRPPATMARASASLGN